MIEVKKAQLRNGFSDRRNIQPLNTEIQLFDFDERTRVKIVNLIRGWYEDDCFDDYRNDFCEKLVKEVFNEYFNDELETQIRYRNDNFFNTYLYLPIKESSYDEVLTIVEYVTNYFSDCYVCERGAFADPYEFAATYEYVDPYEYDYVRDINELFQKEYVGYRFIDREITPISDDIEIEEIKQSLDIEFQGCKSHIKKALGFLSDREKPDYKNSIKESISAVESICKIITKSDTATLNEALQKLKEHGVELHGALKKSFSSLYGYTSDEGGIRHAESLLESKVTFEEAKYMLVSCCAFVNYLIAEYGKINEK